MADIRRKREKRPVVECCFSARVSASISRIFVLIGNSRCRSRPRRKYCAKLNQRQARVSVTDRLKEIYTRLLCGSALSKSVRNIVKMSRRQTLQQLNARTSHVEYIGARLKDFGPWLEQSNVARRAGSGEYSMSFLNFRLLGSIK
jgi:hypothetical protein